MTSDSRRSGAEPAPGGELPAGGDDAGASSGQAAVVAGVHWLYAVAHGLSHDSPGCFPAEEVREILTRQGASPGDIATVGRHISAALEELEAGRAVPFSAEAYDAAREIAITDRRLAGRVRADRAGHRIWPPTSQTVRKRLGSGYWNEAVAGLGYPVSGRGRARGPARYSAADYLAAVADFCDAAGSTGDSTSFTGYQAWAKEQATAGHPRPSGAAMRAHFGSWRAAKDSAT